MVSKAPRVDLTPSFTVIKNSFQKTKSILGLSLVLAKAEFKLRNEGSYLGIFWYLLNPILMFVLLFLIFYDRLGSEIKYYPLYLLTGIVMFNFFQSSTLEAVRSVANNRWIIKSINFPKESLILAIIIKNIFSHFFEILLICLTLLFFEINIFNILFYVPVILWLSFFALGISFILASLTVFFVDIESIWTFAVRLLWFGTPIFYAIEGQARLFYVNLLNPMYYFITIARSLIIYGKMPELWLLAAGFFYGLLFLLLGLRIFNRLKTKFAEKI
jgi:lipopolysaccharide transport system permease protein